MPKLDKDGKPIKEGEGGENEPTLEELQATLEAQKAENDALKEKLEQAGKQTPPPPTRTENVEPTEDQWTKLEAETGMDREDIKKQHALTARMMAPVVQQNADLRNLIAGKDNVVVAMKKAAAGDKEFSKYSPHVEEYLNDLPDAVKADPKQLEKQMEKAIKYGKGSVDWSDKNTRREPPAGGGKPAGNEDPPKGGKGDEELFGEHQGQGDLKNTRLNVRKRVSDEYREKHQHENGVQINEQKDWDNAAEEVAVGRPTPKQ